MVKYYNGLELTGEKAFGFFDFDGVFNALNVKLVYIGEEPLTAEKIRTKKVGDWEVVREPIDNEFYYAPDNEGTASLNDKRYTVQWSSEMVHDLNEIFALDKINPIFLSTWRETGAEYLMPMLGLHIPSTHWLDFDGHSTLHSYEPGKGHTIETLYLGLKHDGGPVPPFVWVDDNATHYEHNLSDPNNQRFAQYCGAPDSLIVKPKAKVGISRYEMLRIREFVENL